MSDPCRDLLVAGHQPNFLPWFGYFEKMLKCDLFVYSDDVQFPKQCYVNRVEIPVRQEAAFLTLPVKKGDDARIADKRYVKDAATLIRLSKTLRINFGGLPHFADVEPVIDEFERAYAQHDMVADLNIHMNQYLAASFGIRTAVWRGTDLRLEAFHRNERLIERCRLLESRNYLCGQGADSYQDEAMLEDAGIHLHRIDYSIGGALFGEALRYSVLYGLGRVGLIRICDAVADYQRHSRGQ
ncbi:WbqC family protein [Synechococcus sp. HJ21-Hayes]|uniref:WbqC family protein n=1 Tax=unclassified Synechococcus TaxID=2626047 RepID=UPI0020CBB193|nr:MULTISPECIES: WbqC family protein [unclassified Synechococcus]MCP9830077.1 WbqC family protein [Synechococcus sp. JJ3a-Johnson]MCP9852115.1 WbqC family protein [Synechococcus sp. HJ21-Hayes]